MFNVNTDTGEIQISKGDTGAIEINLPGCEFSAEDRALFSIRDAQNTVVKQKAYELNNNSFIVTFYNADTDTLPAATTYKWDVRCVFHPYYNDAGDIVDGDQVITPMLPLPFTILPVVGDV